MTAAKDNVNTRLITLITLVSVIFLALIIIATDAAYSWSHTVVNRDNPAGDASMVRNARAAWANEAEALRWANEQKTHAVIPVSRAAQLVLEERKQK